jgi:cell wall-associated NlpC family hydrolase
LKKLIFIFVLYLGLTPYVGSAAPTLETAQREVDRLRTVAAEKFEAANDATIRIRSLERETAALEQQEAKLQKELQAANRALAQLAIAEYKSSGFGETFELLFSSDPTKYLSDAGTLEVISRNYAKKQREFATTKLKVEASQFVISDRTALLKAERVKLNREVEQARMALSKAEKILKSLKKEDRERLARLEAERENKILDESKMYAASYKGDNTRGSIALKYALKQVGDVYVWAAAGPTKWDCSGLTMRAFQQAGVSLPHSSRIQVKYGKSVSFGAVKPGDLLFFGNPISHVSIYMGGGKMVQAPRPGKRVEVIPFTKRFGAKPFVGARRL